VVRSTCLKNIRVEPQKKSCTLHLQTTSASAQRLEVCDPGRQGSRPIITASHKSSKELVKLSLNQVDYSASPKSPGLHHNSPPSSSFTTSSTTDVNAPTQPIVVGFGSSLSSVSFLFHQSRFIQWHHVQCRAAMAVCDWEHVRQ
jgi:hypothetical protein